MKRNKENKRSVDSMRGNDLIILMCENVKIGLYLLHETIGITAVKSEPKERPLFDVVGVTNDTLKSQEKYYIQ
jgi:hypothetical protein